MSCNCNNKSATTCGCQQNTHCCRCSFNTKQFGVANLDRISLQGDDRTTLNWNEISVPEILCIPAAKPDIEHLDQIYVEAQINCAKLIETPIAYKSYDRLATTLEINAAGAAYNTGLALSLADITTAYNNLIAVAPPIAQTVALQNAYNTVVAAATSYANSLAALNTAIGTANLTAAELVNALNAVISSLQVLISAVTALRVAAVALGVAAPAVLTQVTALTTAIDTFLTSANAALVQFQSVVTLIGNTKYFALVPNAENTYLTGRKIVIEGSLKQKIVYTGLVTKQSVHSAHFCVPFTAFVIPYAKFENLTYQENVSVIDPDTGATVIINGFSYNPDDPIVVDLCEEFCVEAFIEDIFACALDLRTIFKNITVFLQAKVATTC